MLSSLVSASDDVAAVFLLVLDVCDGNDVIDEGVAVEEDAAGGHVVRVLATEKRRAMVAPVVVGGRAFVVVQVRSHGLRTVAVQSVPSLAAVVAVIRAVEAVEMHQECRQVGPTGRQQM